MIIPLIKKEIKFSSVKTIIKKIIPYLLALVLLAMFFAVGFLTYSILESGKVYKGVYLDGVHLGGMSKDELDSYLKKNYSYDLNQVEIRLIHKTHTTDLLLSDIDASIDLERTFSQVYYTGRTGNIIKRIKDIYNTSRKHEYLYAELIYSKEKLESIITELHDKSLVPVKSPELLIGDTDVILKAGEYGYSVDKTSLEYLISEQMMKYSSGMVVVPIIETAPPRMNADSFYSMIIQEEKSAFFEVLSNEVVVTPHIIGRYIDKADLLSIIAEIDGKKNLYKTEFLLPVEFITPEYTTELINEMLFRDVLGSFSTSFSVNTENSVNRGINIKLATQKINETILAPQEEFSFNNIVGERTSEKGYAVASAFIDSKVSTAVGGGVCQVSTTLYNAVLKANLKLLERNQHTFIVSYVEAGTDASVSYGTLDFRFANNTDWPIKIEALVSDSNEVLFAIKGTNLHPTITADIFLNRLQTIPFETIYTEDPTLPIGTQQVIHEGVDGAIVDTYMVIKNSGTIVSSYKLSTSTYKPLNKEILKGTKE